MSSAATIAIAIAAIVVLAAVVLVTSARRSDVRGAGALSRETVKRDKKLRTEAAPAGDFFQQLASHWKKNFPGWTAWILSPDARLPGQMRLKETRRVPMWNGPIECRLFRFDLVAGRMPS